MDDNNSNVVRFNLTAGGNRPHRLDPPEIAEDSIWGVGHSTGSLLRIALECLIGDKEEPTTCSYPDVTGFSDAFYNLLCRSPKDPDAKKACEIITSRLEYLLTPDYIYSICQNVLPITYETAESETPNQLAWAPIITPLLERTYVARRKDNRPVIEMDIQTSALLYVHAPKKSVEQKYKLEKLLEALVEMSEYEDPLRVCYVGIDIVKTIFGVLKQDQDGCKKTLMMLTGYCENAAGYAGLKAVEDYIEALIDLAEDAGSFVEMEVKAFANTILESYKADQADISEKPALTLDQFQKGFTALRRLSPASSQAEAASSGTSPAPRHGPKAGTQP